MSFISVVKNKNPQCLQTTFDYANLFKYKLIKYYLNKISYIGKCNQRLLYISKGGGGGGSWLLISSGKESMISRIFSNLSWQSRSSFSKTASI